MISLYDDAALRERVLRLFAAPGAPGSDEREVDALVDAMIAQHLGDPRVGPPGEWDTHPDTLRTTLVPPGGMSPRALAGQLAASVVPRVVNQATPRFAGHMTSALPGFVRPLARLVAALNQNVVKIETSRVLTPIERQSVGMLHRLVYGQTDAFYDAAVADPEVTLGVVASGGTVANLTALWCARNAALGPRGSFAGVEREGMGAALAQLGYRRAVVIGSSLLHYSLDKTVDVLGIGTRNLLRVPVDADNRVDPRAVAAVAAECRARGDLVLAIVGVAGSTDAGSVDPLDALADVAAEHGAFFHVDAAWGGALLFSRRHRPLLRGIERADAVTIDGHKQLYLPMGLGVVLLRDPRTAGAVEKTATYIIRRGSADLGRRSLEGSRPAASLLLAAALRIIGADGYELLVDEGVARARRAAEMIRARPGMQLLSEPQTNIVLYRYLPARHRGGPLSPRALARVNRFNATLQRRQREAGTSFVSRTSLRSAEGEAPVVALRMVLANPLATDADLAAVLDEQAAIAAELEAARSGALDPACLSLDPEPQP